MNKIFLILRENAFLITGYIGIILVVIGISISTRGALITNQFLDPLRTTIPRDEVRIVGIDDASLQYVGAWPWDRRVFAELTDSLSKLGAKEIVFDVLFLERRGGDDLFENALEKMTVPVILSAKSDNEKLLKSFLGSDSSHIIHALPQVSPDIDGKIRLYPKSQVIDGNCIDTLAHAAFVVYKHTTSACNTEERLFRYPNEIQTVSVYDVLRGNISDSYFKNKVVFIGSTALDLEDHFVGIYGEKVPGVYIHASIFTSLLNDINDKTASTAEIVLLISFYSILFGVVLYRAKSLLAQVFITTIFITGLIVCTIISFTHGYTVPFPWLLLTTILCGAYIVGIRFVQEKKRNEYIASLFSKYVHKDVLKELMKTSSSLRFDGEKREMSILFSDIRGFTSLSETMTPEELTTLLNAYLSAMTPAILEERGTIDKFIGDAIMAFWNAPLYVKNHTMHAVSAATRMEKALQDFNEKNNTSLQMGIGIHVGDVIVGNVGSKERVNYTILGDAVNLASRVEGLTKKYGVSCIVTGEVRVLITDDSVSFRKLDTITVKGKTTPTVLYELLGDNKKDFSVYKDYESALALYEKGEFSKAEKIFMKLAESGDKASHMMLARIPIVSLEKNWNGVWHFDEK